MDGVWYGGGLVSEHQDRCFLDTRPQATGGRDLCASLLQMTLYPHLLQGYYVEWLLPIPEEDTHEDLEMAHWVMVFATKPGDARIHSQGAHGRGETGEQPLQSFSLIHTHTHTLNRFYFTYMGVLPACMSVHRMRAWCCGGQRRVSDLWNLSYRLL